MSCIPQLYNAILAKYFLWRYLLSANSLSSSLLASDLLPHYLIAMQPVVFNYTSLGWQSVVVFFIMCRGVWSLGYN